MRDPSKPRPGVPEASSDAARKRMEAAKGHDTKPERRLRSHLHRLGLRFRIQRKLLHGLRRKADIVFGPARVVVFIDGCFWHGCPEHYRAPSRNSSYWAPKVARNRARDADTDAQLAKEGWTVLRFWEHDNALEAAKAVAATVLRVRVPSLTVGNV